MTSMSHRINSLIPSQDMGLSVRSARIERLRLILSPRVSGTFVTATYDQGLSFLLLTTIHCVKENLLFQFFCLPKSSGPIQDFLETPENVVN